MTDNGRQSQAKAKIGTGIQQQPPAFMAHNPCHSITLSVCALSTKLLKQTDTICLSCLNPSAILKVARLISRLLSTTKSCGICFKQSFSPVLKDHTTVLESRNQSALTYESCKGYTQQLLPGTSWDPSSPSTLTVCSQVSVLY